jgi:hypothetical protein
MIGMVVDSLLFELWAWFETRALFKYNGDLTGSIKAVGSQKPRLVGAHRVSMEPTRSCIYLKRIMVQADPWLHGRSLIDGDPDDLSF